MSFPVDRMFDISKLQFHDVVGDTIKKMSSCQTTMVGELTDDNACSEHSRHDSVSQESDDGPRRGFTPYHSQSVPKSENLSAHVSGEDDHTESVTTLMLRNIPNKYSQNLLMEEIDDCGFRLLYNFFYLPMDVHNRSNVGYAFINFYSPVDAQRFREEFNDHRFRKVHSRKVSTVSPAHVQGLDENLRHFENRAVTHSKNDQYRPIVLRGGVRVDFDTALADAKARIAGARSGARDGGAGRGADAPRRNGTGKQPSPEPTSFAEARRGLEYVVWQLLLRAHGLDTHSALQEADLAPPPGLTPVKARPVGKAAHGSRVLPSAKFSPMPCRVGSRLCPVPNFALTAL